MDLRDNKEKISEDIDENEALPSVAEDSAEDNAEDSEAALPAEELTENDIPEDEDAAEARSISEAGDDSEDGKIPESEYLDEDSFQEEPKKPKKHKNRTLVVATAIFAVTALSFGVWYSFFNNDISGVWATDVEVEDSEGNTSTAVMKFAFDSTEQMSFFENEKYYFSDKETTNPTLRMLNGGVIYPGTYSLSSTESTDETEGKNTIQIFISVDQSTSSYDYELSGNIFTGRQLTFTDGDTEETISFYQSDESSALDPDEDFTPNTGVVGVWETSEGLAYTFTEDGRFSEESETLTVDGVYNFGETDDGDDAIIVKYIRNGAESTTEIPYLLDGDTMTLTFNGYDVEVTKTSE